MGEGRGESAVVFTVGGTNGKGSTCAYLERILIESGYRVGLYTSPHLLAYNERVRLQGEEASDDALVASFERVEAARGDTPLTYFEFGTLAALWIFQEAKLDAWVLEVGLGGRLDAVNIVDADASIVVSVDLDHQAFLGSDRESIGYEKAGIFRAGRPAIFGDTDPPARLEAHALAIGADLQVLGRDYRVAEGERQWDFVGRRSTRRALPIPALRGRWQLKNAAAALAALDEVAQRLPVSIGEVKRGLTTVRLAARLQALPGGPPSCSTSRTTRTPRARWPDALGEMGFFENTFAVFAMLGDKDIAGVVEAVRHRIDRWFVSAAQADRAAPAAKVAGILASGTIRASPCAPSPPSRPRSAKRVVKRVRMIELSSSDRSIPWRKRCGHCANFPWRAEQPPKRSRSGGAAAGGWWAPSPSWRCSWSSSPCCSTPNRTTKQPSPPCRSRRPTRPRRCRRPRPGPRPPRHPRPVPRPSSWRIPQWSRRIPRWSRRIPRWSRRIPPSPRRRPGPRSPTLQGFAVQVGAYRDEKTLGEARAKLAAAGIAHYTERLEGSQAGLTRLRAGPFPTREAAEKAKAALKADALDGQVVPLP